MSYPFYKRTAKPPRTIGRMVYALGRLRKVNDAFDEIIFGTNRQYIKPQIARYYE